MRTPIIAGNWKMNMTGAQGAALVKALVPLVKDAKCEVVLCPPFTALFDVNNALEHTNIKLGAQNVHWEQKGAFTGEVSAEMLKALGVSYAIIGHSERRQYFGETDETVNSRAKAALKAGIIPIICVGESLSQREAGETDAFVSRQTVNALSSISQAEVEKLVIAYEPIWAIGTGRTASSEQANETIGVVRGAVRGLYGEETASKVRILYGGSMNPKNASALMAMDELDGGLIGGASLLAEDFAAVINF
ncbi:MAG: Triosephosphate isomerase [Firmicutes bacterium ADurb.Bin356]|nr:MAG: Triosephosphate isomerase [Firmicutes bacterium ADurb.Bin356]